MIGDCAHLVTLNPKKKKKIPLGGRHSIKDLYLVNYYPPPQFGGGRKSARVWVVGGWGGRSAKPLKSKPDKRLASRPISSRRPQI